MGIWILEGDAGGLDRAVLIDGTTERPLPLHTFHDHDEADGFLSYSRHVGVDDLRRLDAEALDQLHTRWLRLSPDFVCVDVGMPVVAATDEYGAAFRLEVLADGRVLDRTGRAFTLIGCPERECEGVSVFADRHDLDRVEAPTEAYRAALALVQS